MLPYNNCFVVTTLVCFVILHVISNWWKRWLNVKIVLLHRENYKWQCCVDVCQCELRWADVSLKTLLFWKPCIMLKCSLSLVYIQFVNSSVVSHFIQCKTGNGIKSWKARNVRFFFFATLMCRLAKDGLIVPQPFSVNIVNVWMFASVS
jgi:hypothetical protein